MWDVSSHYLRSKAHIPTLNTRRDRPCRQGRYGATAPILGIPGHNLRMVLHYTAFLPQQRDSLARTDPSA